MPGQGFVSFVNVHSLMNMKLSMSCDVQLKETNVYSSFCQMMCGFSQPFLLVRKVTMFSIAHLALLLSGPGGHWRHPIRSYICHL